MTDSPPARLTFCTPTLPGRLALLSEARESVRRQSHTPCLHLWREDTDRRGPAAVRNDLLAEVDTEFVGFLDDDDVLYPPHAQVLLGALSTSGACVAYPWFRFKRPDRRWPLGEFLQMRRPDGTSVHAYRQPFDPAALGHSNFIPVTVVARTACLREVGGFPLPGTPEWPHETCEDWGLWRRLVKTGHTFIHVPEVTWEYRVHGGNTSGSRTV